MEQKLIEMIERDKELEYMLWELLYAKENNVNCSGYFKYSNGKIRKRSITVTSLIKSRNR